MIEWTTIHEVGQMCPDKPMDPKDPEGYSIRDHFYADAQGVSTVTLLDEGPDEELCNQEVVEFETYWDSCNQGWRIDTITIKDPKIGANRLLHCDDYEGLEYELVNHMHPENN
jgi:hypothetical protein